jgi:hypothetical protein
MNNGTSRAVLVSDLFRGDGPFIALAEDFVAMVCGLCGQPADAEARFTIDGFLCSACASALSLVTK